MEVVACNLCGSWQSRLIYQVPERLLRKDIFQVVICQECGLIFVNPRPSLKEIGNYYPEDYPLYRFIYPNSFFPKGDNYCARIKGFLKCFLLHLHYGYFEKGKKRLNIPLLKGLVQWLTLPFKYYLGWIFPPAVKGGRVLDVGCSTGIYLGILRELGWDTYGVEPNEKVASWARDHLGHKIFCGFLEEAGFPNNFFDTVIFSHSLEHTFNPISNLRETFRILSPGGRLLVWVPNARSLDRFLFRARAFQWEVPRHLTHFTPRTIQKALEIVGFESIQIEYPLHPYNLVLSANYWLQDHFPKWRDYFPHWIHPDQNRWVKRIGWIIGLPLSIFRITDRMNVHAQKPQKISGGSSKGKKC